MHELLVQGMIDPQALESHICRQASLSKPDNDLGRLAVDVAHNGDLHGLFVVRGLVDTDSVNPQHPRLEPVAEPPERCRAVCCDPKAFPAQSYVLRRVARAPAIG